MSVIKGTSGNAYQSGAFIYASGNDTENSFTKKLKEMSLAAESLSKSAEAAPIAARQTLLNGLLKQCEMLNSVLFSAKSWNALMKVYAKAKGLSMSDKPSMAELKRVISQLSAALAALENADMREEDEEELRQGLPVVMKLNGCGQSEAPAAAETAPSGGVDVSV